MNEILHIGNVRCEPGQVTFGTILSAYQRNGRRLEVPIIVVNGAAAGPVLWLGSATHGNEIPGIEVIRRLVHEAIAPSALRGALLACPLQNPLAYDAASRLTPVDSLNLNRVFPGDAAGPWTARLAHDLFEEGIAHADVVLDLHATNGEGAVNFNLLRTGGEGAAWERQWELARAFGITMAVAPAKKGGLSGMLHDAALAHGKPALTVELAGGYAFEEDSVRAGLIGILNVMKHLGMIDGELAAQTAVLVIEEPLRFHPEVRVDTGGIVYPLRRPGQEVGAGEPVVRIYDLYGRVKETVVSPVSGWLIALSRVLNHTVASGDGVFFVCSPLDG